VAGASLLTLLDDIATVLDDVAILSKVAVKKTAGVLGDDLALNAEQVSGVKADRELPVVWAVAKGSFLNKLILVPSALLISAFLPPLITVLLVLGGLFLCFEGFEKVSHKYFHSKKTIAAEHKALLEAVSDENIDIAALEKEKIKGAIRTDFILSAEIVVIVLGSVQDAPFQTQVLVVSLLAIAITIGVYGLVAAIVKLDDLGLYLLRKSVAGRFNAMQRSVGRGLLVFAPFLMKLLTVVGTIAMFLVGGGIIVHSFSWLNGQFTNIEQWIGGYLGTFSESILSILLDGITGIVAGGLVLAIVSTISRLKNDH
jgi:predicted DNA repair protein MutK|tara:strand:+ start:3631 stop:4569 length:939 start_codon:yes stop_codon:yes gene_type:complete